MAFATANVVPLTGNPYIDGLTQGSAWQFGDGPRIITYSLNVNDTLDGVGQPLGGTWEQYPALHDAVDRAIAEWGQFIDVTFQKIGVGGVYNQSSADIAIILTGNELQQDGALAVGLYPDPILGNSVREDGNYPNPEGDIAIDNYDPVFAQLQAGEPGYVILLHEIGHALGLKHPGDDGANSRPTYSDLGIAADDQINRTIMTGQLPPFGGLVNTPMELDIQAIQFIYGVSTSSHLGDDVYFLRHPRNIIWDSGGIDTFDASNAPYSAYPRVIDLRPGHFSGEGRTGIANGVIIENAIGGVGADLIIGNDADNRIEGRGGGDVLRGGPGDDTYVMGAGQIFTTIEELPGEGIDTIENADRVRPFVENLTLPPGTGSLAGYGDDVANVIRGNAGSNELYGYGGDDTLYGAAGNDILIGGDGADRLYGGFGDDRFIVDSASDLVIELPDEGTDSVEAGFTYTLPANVENLRLTESGPLDGYGNGEANELRGNASNNLLDGGGGNDVLFGGGGDDHLVGGPGDDRLIGEGGEDVLLGGSGDDIYVIADLSDSITENADEGNDTVVFSGERFTLPDNIENLYLDPAPAVLQTGTGNALDNRMVSNVSAARLYGGPGNDVLDGGRFGGNALYGEEGNDRLLGPARTQMFGGPGDDVYETSLVDHPWTYTFDLTGPSGNPLLDGSSIHYDETSRLLSGYLQDLERNADSVPDSIFLYFNLGNEIGWSFEFQSVDPNQSFTVGTYQPTAWGRSFELDRFSVGYGYYKPLGLGSVTVTEAIFIPSPLYPYWQIQSFAAEFEFLIDGTNAPLLGRIAISGDPATGFGSSITELPNEGNDTLVLEAGVDMARPLDLAALNLENITVNGAGRVDVLGSSDANVLTGNDADNLFTGRGGDDILEGRGGADTAQFSGASNQYAFIDYLGAIRVVDRVPARDGVDSLASIEFAYFAGDNQTQAIASADVFLPLEYVASYPDLMAGFGINAELGYAHFVETGRYEGRRASFHGLQYVASYADLMDGFGANAELSTVHYISSGRFEGRTATFSGLEYVASYADLMNTMGVDGDAGTTHYITEGRFQGRHVGFSGLDYIASYTDLMDGYGTNADAGSAHYIAVGRFEGRAPTFSGLEYIASYPDLIAGFGANGVIGTTHYIESGRFEGRQSSFSALGYIASYADLIQGFGANPDLGASHYITRGRYEVRTEHFDAAQYLANYADLQAGFGGDLRSATIHYIQAGFFEGRTDQAV